MEQDFKLRVGVWLVLRQNNEILLLLRQGTGYADGKYGLVGGALDGKERVSDAMIREAQEEVGVVIARQDLHFSCVMHDNEQTLNREYVDFFFICDRWQNEICNKEPQYCAELKFFPHDKLPENTLGYIRQGITQSLAKQIYCEHGWDE